MENNNIQTKVNRIGKAGRIVSIILIVLLGIGVLSLLIGGIACAILPKDMVEVTLRPVVDVKVDKELMGAEWANIDKLLSEAQEKAGQEFEGAGVALEKGDEGLLVHVDPKEEADRDPGHVPEALQGFRSLPHPLRRARHPAHDHLRLDADRLRRGVLLRPGRRVRRPLRLAAHELQPELDLGVHGPHGLLPLHDFPLRRQAPAGSRRNPVR